MERFITWAEKGYKKHIRSIIIAFLITAFGSYVFWGNAVVNPDTFLKGIPHNLGTWDIQIGRYGLFFFYALNHGFSSSYFSTFIAIFFFLIAGLCIIDLFKIENELVKIVIMVLISCSPYTMAVITYPFCSDANAAGAFLGIFAIWIWSCFKYNKIGAFFGALSLAFSISIYQSNIGITAIVGFIVLIKISLKDRKFLKTILNFITLMIVGSVLYYVGLKISLAVYGVELVAYKGADRFSLMNMIRNLPTSISKCYLDFFLFYFTKSYRMSNAFGTSTIYILLGIASLLCIMRAILIGKLEKLQLIFVVLLLLLSPIACNLINLVVPGTDIGMLLVFPMMSFPVLLCALCYNLQEKKDIIWVRGLHISLSFFLFLLTINYIFINNVDGLEYKRHEDQFLYLANRVYSKLEDRGVLTDPNITVGIFGSPSDGNYKWEDEMHPYINDYATLGFLWGGSYSSTLTGWKGIFTMYLGDTSIQWCTWEEGEAIVKSEEFKNAPNYPSEGSILKMEDVIVIKMANYIEN